MGSRRTDYLRPLAEMYQKYLHTSSGEPTWWKYNGKSGCESNLLVRLIHTADPRDQSPNPPTFIVHIQTPKEETQILPWKSQPDLMLGLLSMVSGHLWTQSLLHAHILCPQRNIHGSLQITSGALVYTRNWQWPNMRRRHRKGHLPLSALQITKDLQSLLL